MTVLLENDGNFENGIPIPDYQIHLVFDQIPYDFKTKSNIRNSTLGWSWKKGSQLENIWMFYSTYHIKAPF